MSLVIDAIQQFARAPEPRIAIVQQQRRITYHEFWERVEFWRLQLRKSGARVVACCVSNRLQALEIELACQAADLVSLVLPSDCSAGTLHQLVLHNGIEYVLTDRGELFKAADMAYEYNDETGLYRFLSPVLQQMAVPANCAMLSLDPTATTGLRLLSISQEAVDHSAQYLAGLRIELGIERHLSLPFAPALSETLSGQYATLIAGGCCVLPENSSIRQSSYECTALINDYARFLCVNDVQSVLIPAKHRQPFLEFVENNAKASDELNMLLIAGQPDADVVNNEIANSEIPTRPQPMIYHLWGTPGHALPYALLRPAATHACLLPHCKVSVGMSDRLYLHAGAALVLEDDDLVVRDVQLDIGLAGGVDEANFLHLADGADQRNHDVAQRTANSGIEQCRTL